MTPREFADARIELGLTVQVLAERLGVERSTVHRWEAGQRAIPRVVGLAIQYLVLTESAQEYPVILTIN